MKIKMDMKNRKTSQFDLNYRFNGCWRSHH